MTKYFKEFSKIFCELAKEDSGTIGGYKKNKRELDT